MRASFLTNVATVALIALSPGVGPVRNTPLSARADGPRLGQAAKSRSRGGLVTNGLEVFIEAQRAPIQEDQPIAIVFHVTNVRSANFDFGWCRSSWEPNFRVAITTDRGQSISRSGPGLGMESNMGGRIRPGQEHVEVGDLRDEYALRPGEYYVTAVATLVEDGIGAVRPRPTRLK
jgi:hypothetical protein